MTDLIAIAIVVTGQFYVCRWSHARLRRPLGTVWARRATVALAALLAALLAVLWLDNAWLGHSWETWRRLGTPGPSVARALSFTAGIWVAGSAVGTLLLLGEALWRRRRPTDLGRRSVLGQAARAAALASPFGVAAYATLRARRQFELREVAFPTSDLPPPLEGFRIAVLTDIHFGPYLSGPELDHVVAMANETRPHLTVVAGDLITRVDDPLEGCLSRLAPLRAQVGVFGCLGNHEIYARCQDYAEQRARSMGIEFLRRRNHLVQWRGARLNLAGVDYQRQQRRYLVGAERLIQPGAVNLLLSHNPDVFPVAADLGYDLVVGGHTHGGQVTVEILEQTLNPGRFFTPFVAGLYRRGRSSLYVSRGIGTINLPMRLGARPEVSLLTLRRA